MLGSIILTDRPSLSVFGGNVALRGFLVVGFYSHVLCLVQLFAVIRLAESYSEKLPLRGPHDDDDGCPKKHPSCSCAHIRMHTFLYTTLLQFIYCIL